VRIFVHYWSSFTEIRKHELHHSHIAFQTIALQTRGHEILGDIAAAPRLRDDMVNRPRIEQAILTHVLVALQNKVRDGTPPCVR